MASPIFNPPSAPKSLESLAQDEIRSILKLYRQGSVLVVAADTHPGIFEHALSKVQAGEDFLFRGIGPIGKSPQPVIHLVKSKLSNLEIGGIRIQCKFPSDQEGTLEDYLFITIGEAFISLGFEVVNGLPNRYQREWVI